MLVKNNYTKSGRTFSADEIQIIQDITQKKYYTCRCEISRSICEKLNWFSENGNPKDWICRELLIQLEKDGLITLPPPQLRSFNRFKEKKIKINFTPPREIYEGKLSEFLKPEFHKVNTSKDNTYWEYLVGNYHYLGYKGVMGRFLKYIIYLTDVPIACIGWTGAALNVGARDRWIGWNSDERKKGLKNIANNFRFVIFPWARIKFLASHLLGRSVPIIRRDWKEQYNVEIFMLETFVDKNRFSGTSYKASNWQCVGETIGYGKRKQGYVKHGLKKDVYLYPIDLNNLLVGRDAK